MPKRLLPERDPMRPEVSLALLLSSRIQHVMRTAQGALGLLGRAEPLNVGLLRPAPGVLPGQHNRHGVSIRPRTAYSTNRTDMAARSRQTSTRFRYGRKRPTQPTRQAAYSPTRRAGYSTNTAGGLFTRTSALPARLVLSQCGSLVGMGRGRRAGSTVPGGISTSSPGLGVCSIRQPLLWRSR
jgi:hypothetical protein